jgi:DinB superfamily
MTLRPEQVKAKEYLNQQGSRRTAPQLRERVAAAFTAIEEFLDGVSGSEAGTRGVPGEWTIQEVVDHLVETHRPSVVELRELLAGRRPADGPIPASLQSPDPMSRSWPDLVDALKRVQAETVEVLAAAPDQPTDARAEVVMVINVKRPDGSEEPLHWIEELDWKAYAIVFRLHVLDHLNQAKKVLRNVRGA